MNDFFAPSIPTEALRSSAFRIARVEGANMAPTLRGSFDYVLLSPIDRYDGEGIYMLDDGGLFRVQGIGGGQVRLINDDPTYPMQLVSRKWFDGHITAKVVALIKVQDQFLLEGRPKPTFERVHVS